MGRCGAACGSRHGTLRCFVQELVELIKITETEITSCMDESHDLLGDASRYLDDAGEAYVNVSRELSRLDVAYERLLVFVDSLAAENTNLRPLVDEATEHARQLQIQADQLDRCVAEMEPVKIFVTRPDR